MAAPVIIPAAVEGMVDDVVVRRLIAFAGGQAGTVYGRNGKQALRQKINGYNRAARHRPWVVLVDLDREADCAPPLRDEWLSDPAPNLCFRVAVRAIETWLMADAETLARFLGVSRTLISGYPEELENPKEAMVNLARRSRRRAIREDMVPRHGSGRPVGPAYTSTLSEYAETYWRLDVATHYSDSLRRALACIRRLVADTRSELSTLK